MRALLASLVFVVAAAGSTVGCSALLDWSDFSGGTGEAGADGAGGGDASAHDAAGNDAPASTCGLACETAPPAGWAGPVALSVTPSSQGAAPACGSGFDATPAFDGFAGLTFTPPTCSTCSCGSGAGVTCTGPTMSFFVDSACSTAAASPMTVSSTCVTTPFAAQYATLSSPTATGGTCASSGGAPTAAAPTWATVARACAPSAAPTGDGCTAGQVCAPAPAAPFSSRACVMQAGMATACPPEYPDGPQVFFSSVDDQRGCTPCECAGPTGAQCTIAAPAVDISVTPSCSVSAGSLDAPSPCVMFQGLEFVNLASPLTLGNPGTCALTGGGAPTGVATQSGPTSFCCGL